MQDLTTLSEASRLTTFVIIPDGGTIWLQNVVDGTPQDVTTGYTEGTSVDIHLKNYVQWTWRSEGGTNPQVKWY